MRLLALDLGTVRIGVAVCDELGLTVRPLSFIARHGGRRDLLAVERLVREQEAAGVVLGLPLNMDGSEGPAAQKTRRFAQSLHAHLAPLKIPVHLWDERLSTWEAEGILRQEGVRASRRRQKVDALAAALILESYLAAQTPQAPE